MGVIDIYYAVFLSYRVLTFRHIPEIWRIVTTFVLTGPKIGLVLDPYFLYTYGSALETTSPSFSQPGDFFVYLVFVCVVILVRMSSPYRQFCSGLPDIALFSSASSL